MSVAENTAAPAAKAKRGLPVGLVTALLIKGAKLAKLFAIGKPLLTFGTMAVSLFAYAFFMGPWFAVLFILLMLIHEMGHVAAMKLKGFDTPTPVFIPFFGAAVFAPHFGSRQDEAIIGYAGPLLGSIAALALFGLSFLPPRESELAVILHAASYAGVFLNLFNLLPISPLDGGRVTQAVGRWFRYIGLIGLAAFSVLLRQPEILLIWILVLGDLKFIPARLRAGLAVLLTFSMLALMLTGDDHSWVWILVDGLLAAFFSYGMIVEATRPQAADRDDRTPLTVPQRGAWLVLYLGLVAVLGVTLAVQSRAVPGLLG